MSKLVYCHNCNSMQCIESFGYNVCKDCFKKLIFENERLKKKNKELLEENTKMDSALRKALNALSLSNKEKD